MKCTLRRMRHRRYVGPARTKPPADLIDGFSESEILRLAISIGRLCGRVLILFRMPCGSASRRCCRPFPEHRRRYPGRLRVPDRTALAGVLYVLRTGVVWRDVPAESVGCSEVTAWRRLRDWTEAGVWPRVHEVLPAELRSAGVLEMDDCAIDGSHVRALKGGITPDLRRSTEAGRAASTT